MDDILNELEVIRRIGNGVLYPEAVVEYAKDETTALHSKFEWDDEKAGHQHRIWQARHLIKIIVTYEPTMKQEVTYYHSLTTDRVENGGYRAIVDILSNECLRTQLLKDALRDFDYWKQKYITIKELTPIFNAREKV
jgi:hypothetical protein